MRQYLNNPWVVLGLCVVAATILYLNMEEERVRPTVPLRPLPLTASRAVGVTGLSTEDFSADDSRLGWATTPERDPFVPAAEQIENSHGTPGYANGQVADLLPPQPCPSADTERGRARA